MTERLEKVFAAGGTEALFPLLCDWPKDELRLLIKDVEEYAQGEEKRILAKYGELACGRIEFVFNKRNAKALDEARDSACMNLMGIASEIIAIALLYLGDEAGANSQE